MKVTNLDLPVMSSWIEDNALRLDSAPYLSGAMEAKVLLDNLRVEKVPLHQLTKGHNGGIYNGPQFVRNYVNDPAYGVPFLTSSSMLLADLSTVGLLRKNDAESPKLNYLCLREGMTLISCSGTVGRMVYTRPDMEGMWSSQDILKVVPDPEKILPGYLYAYLSSRFGLPLVISGTYGAIIQHIEAEHLVNIPIPRISRQKEEEIHALIARHAQALAKYGQLMDAGTRLLLANTQLAEFDDSVWSADRKNLGWEQTGVGSESFRALNYDPRAAAIRHAIEQNNFEFLGSLCDPERFKGKCIFKRIDASPGYGYMLVGQKKAFHVRPDGRWISRKSIEGLGLQVPPGTSLIPSHGTLGERELYCRAVYVTKKTSEYAFSGDFFRCIPLRDKVPPGYLYAFLRSRPAFRLLRSTSIGGKQQEQHPDMMWHLPIPRLDYDTEAIIGQKIDEAASSFDEGLKFEEKAWEILECEIQKLGRENG